MASPEITNNINKALGYGCYLVTTFQFFQFALFTGNAALYFPGLRWFFPNSIDDSLHVVHPNSKWDWQLNHPMINDILLVSLYALAHSMLARLWFKGALREYVSFWFERLFFIMCSSLAFATLTYYWKPFTNIIIWNFRGNPIGSIMQGIFLAGLAWIGITLYYAARYDLFDYRKAFGEFGVPSGIPYNLPPVYRVNRQPLYFGILVSFWATPKMTLGHFIFTALMTIYTTKAVAYQETDALRTIGSRFAEYQKMVPLYWPSINNLYNLAAATPMDRKKYDVNAPPMSPVDVHNYQHVNRR